jgi:ubiquinone biosynthesis protein COQ4
VKRKSNWFQRTATAIRYFLLLLRHPDDRVRYGALFVTSSEGSSFERTFQAFAASPAGCRLLEEKPDTMALLRDKHRLASCPAGSLGRHYLEYMRACNIDESYYQPEIAAAAVRDGGDAQHAWFRIRTGSLHDLNHLLSGYGPDSLGEACLLTFRFAQLRHYGLLTLALMLFLKLKLRGERNVLAAMIEAYRRGLRSRLLELLPSEDGLEVSLAEPRAVLGLTRPKRYGPMLAPHAYASIEASSWLEALRDGRLSKA